MGERMVKGERWENTNDVKLVSVIDIMGKLSGLPRVAIKDKTRKVYVFQRCGILMAEFGVSINSG